jgi:hypothetical protein
MIRNITKITEKRLLLIAALPALLLLLPGCPDFQSIYHVYYDGNGHTSGKPPLDSTMYSFGSEAVILDKSADLKKRDLAFLGWHRIGNAAPLQAGDRIIIDGDVFLYAWWEDDPDANTYAIEDDPSGGGVIIAGYSRYNYDSPIVVIPETLDEKPVIGIGEAAFAGAYLQAVTLPVRLKFIGNKAFAGNSLSRLQIPDSVQSIGKLAFQNVWLESLSLGSGLELIDDYAFDGNRLQNLFLPSQVKQLGEGAFADNPLETIEIGDAVAILNDTALGIHGAAFRKHYAGEGSKAGVYLYKTGGWEGPYHK